MTHFKGVKVVIKKGWTSSSPRMIEKDIKKYVSATQKFEVTLLNLFQDILADKPTFSVISRWILTKILKQDLADKSASSKLRIVGRSSVTKYLARHRNPPNIGIFLEDSPKLFSRKKVIPKLKKLLAKNDLSYSDLYESQSASLDSKNSINSLLKSLILSVNLSAVKPCQLEYVSKCKRYKFVSCSMSYNISYLESFFKRDKNEPLYKLYNILNLEAKKAKGVSFGDTYGSVGVIYSKIYKLFTEIYKKKIKMDNQNVAHYCKKLEKQGFIICTILQQNSERKIFLRSAYFRKYLSVAYGFLNDLGYFDKLLNRKVFMDEEPHQGSFQKLPEIIVYPLSYKPEEEQKEEVQEEEASSTISPVIDIDFNEMTIRE